MDLSSSPNVPRSKATTPRVGVLFGSYPRQRYFWNMLSAIRRPQQNSVPVPIFSENDRSPPCSTTAFLERASPNVWRVNGTRRKHHLTLGLHVISCAIEENLNARCLLCLEPELFTRAV